MANTLNTYISQFLVDRKRDNNDIVTVTSQYIDGNNIYELDQRVIAPNVVQTEDSLLELKPEISEIYPYKIVLPTESDGSTLLLSRTINTPVTASQNYYVPLYFERYNVNIMRAINKDFEELEFVEILEGPYDEDAIANVTNGGNE
jgi:hypothetical protein